jgi:hypothetical protein
MSIAHALLATVLPVLALKGEPEPQGRSFVLEAPAPLHFSLPTNVGLVEGTVDVVRIDSRGVEGWGRFELRMTIDPKSVSTGDTLRDAQAQRVVLSGDEGALLVASTDRLPSIPTPEGTYVLGASTWMDARRGRKHLDLRYTWEGDAESGTIRFTHEATLEELGLRPPAHPFITVTGPLTVKFSAKLVRSR